MVFGLGVRVFVAQRFSTANAMHTQGITYSGCSDDLHEAAFLLAEPEVSADTCRSEDHDQNVEDQVGATNDSEGVRHRGRDVWIDD